MKPAWVPDVLGRGFESRTLPLGVDEEGEVVATLVRRRPHAWQRLGPYADVDVLYVHGWSDYFFQTRLARYWTDLGARFHALDLRKYGRSLREGQTPGYIADLATYDEDIAAALGVMGWSNAGGPRGRRLVLFAHSTGGLVLSLWAARHPGIASAMILNSPWLELQTSGISRAAIAPVLGLRARMRPLDTMPQIDLGFYARAQAEVADPSDPVTVVPQWRPERSMSVHPGWLYAVLNGHAKVAAGLGIDIPVCVLLSSHSVVPTRWSEELTRADSVLTVELVARAALKLGRSVTVERIDGALHDVFLSAHDVRNEAYARLDRWARGVL